MSRARHRGPPGWESVIPFRSWLGAPILRQLSTLVFVYLVVAPAIIFWYVSSLPGSSHSSAFDYKALGWAFAAYIGVAWLIVLWLLVSPRLVAWHAGLVIALALVTQLPLAEWLETRLHSNYDTLGPAIFTIGVPEELTKFIPVVGALALTLVLARGRMRSWLELSPRSYLFLGAISGLAFGCAEQAHYLVDVYVPTLVKTGDAYAYTEQVTWRLITDPITHACWAGISGYFIGIAIQRLRVVPVDTARRLAKELGVGMVGLAIAAVLHGFNDRFSSISVVWVLITALSTLLFVAYAIAGEAVEKALVGAGVPRWTFRVGDSVQLPAEPPPAFDTGTEHVAWRRSMNAHLGQRATITRLDADRAARLDLDGGATWWALDWLRPRLRVGERVRIPQTPQPPFDAGPAMVTWQPDMDAVRGRAATVTAVGDNGVVHLDVGRPDAEWAVDWLERDRPKPTADGRA